MAPKNFVPYTGLDPRAYHELKAREKKHRSIEDILHEIERRTDLMYGEKLIPLARYSAAYAADTFPAFEIVYPEAIGADWLAMTGWQKHQRDHLIHQPLVAYTVLKLLRGWNKENPFAIERTIKTNKVSIPLIDACVDTILFSPGCRYLKEYLVRMGVKENSELLNPCCDHQCNLSKPITERPRKCRACTLWKMMFIEAAFMAAMLHDLGYSWQYARMLMRAADYTDTITTLKYEHHKITPLSFANRLLYAVLNGYQFSAASQPVMWDHRVSDVIAKAFDDTHGLPGAFTFLLLCDAFRDYPREKTHTYPLRQFIIEWASVAICMHDMPSVYRGKSKIGEYPEHPQLRVSFDKDPLSAVLGLADYLQEFERHSVEIFKTEDALNCSNCRENRCGKNLCPTLAFSPSCSEVEFHVKQNVATIIFHQDDVASVRNKNYFIHKSDGEYLSHFSQTGFLDFSWLGIDKFDILAKLKAPSLRKGPDP